MINLDLDGISHCEERLPPPNVDDQEAERVARYLHGDDDDGDDGDYGDYDDDDDDGDDDDNDDGDDGNDDGDVMVQHSSRYHLFQQRLAM